MAYSEFASSPQTLNKARFLCDKAIARLAPQWMHSPVVSPYILSDEGHVVPTRHLMPEDSFDDEALPAEFLSDTTDPDYMHGLTEAERAQVRRAGGTAEDKAGYAENLRRWKEGEDWQ